MKQWGYLLICLWVGITLRAQPLPVSPEGQREATLYLDFMQAIFDEEEMGAKKVCVQYKRILSQDPQNKLLRRQLLLCALEQGLLAEAEQYADFITMGENDGEDLAVYAFYQWRSGHPQEARSYYEQALEKAPDDTRILYQYTLLLGYLDVDRAAQILQARKQVLPELSAELDYETGNLYAHHKQWKTALEYYAAAIKTKPDYVAAYLARADIYEKTSQFFLMIHELETLEKIGYQDATMYSRMGSFYVLVKDTARAQEYFLKAKQLNPADIPAGYFLAIYAEQEGDFKRAAQYLQETADYNENASKWLQVSFYQQQAGQNEQALHTLQEAYKRFSGNVEIGYFYSLLLQDEGHYRRAARVLQGVLKTNPDYEQARLAYAFCLEELGKYKQMETEVRRLLAQNPNAAAYNLLGFSLADRNERLDEAQELITKALAISPNDQSFIDSLAWVYYRQGKYTEALDLLKSLGAAFINQHTDVQYHIGAVYAALGDTQPAIDYLQRAAGEQPQAARLLKTLSR